MLSDKIKHQIIAHAQSRPDQEVCGLVCGEEVIRCLNVAESPQDAFQIPVEYFDSLLSITAIYHSHWRDSQPSLLSKVDIAHSKAVKLPYILFHTAFGEWDYYDPSNIYPFPLIPNLYTPKSLEYYLGWRFEYNRSDCYTLIRSYYKGMLDLHLPDFPRGDIEETTSPAWDMFQKNFSVAGFHQLGDDEPLQPNDIILMSIVGDRTHHAAILLDPSTGKSLHNLGEGRLSELFMYGGYWLNQARMLVRFRS